MQTTLQKPTERTRRVGKNRNAKIKRFKRKAPHILKDVRPHA